MADASFYIDTSGVVQPVPPEQVAGAEQLGWVPASPKQIADYQLAQKVAGPLEGAKAFGEHAASALTLGLSDVVERKLGVDPELMRARERAHPIASTAGTVLGIAAPLALTGGASAAADAAELTGPALVAKLGKASAKAVSEALPESMSGRLVAKAVASGAGSAIEGAAYGAGQVVHEAALGDPNLTAQSALATVGLSAALGGALGASGGVLSHALGEAAENMPSWMKDTLADFEGERNLKAAGGTQSDIARLVKQKGRENLRSIGREGRDLGLLGVLSSPESVAEKSQALLTDAGDRMTALLAKADSAGEPEAFKITRLTLKARDEILDPLAKNPLQQPAAKQFAAALDGYQQKYASGMTLQDLQQMRRDVSDAIYGLRGNMDPSANSYKDALHDFRNLISEDLSAGVDRAGLNSADWKALNRQYEVGKVFQKLADRGMDRAHGNNLVSPTELLGAVGGGATAGPFGAAASGLATAAARRYGSSMLGAAARALRKAIDPELVVDVVNKTADAIAAERSVGADTISAAAGANAPEKVATLSLLERLNQRVTQKIETHVATIVRGSAKASYVGRGEVAAGISKIFGADTETAQATYGRRTEQVRQLAQDPELMEKHLSAQVDDWHQHAPDTAQALQITTARAVAFLASKLPQTQQAGPLSPKWTPSRAEMSKFNRYYEAVQKPTILLKQAAAGTLTRESLEAVQAVYPDLFAKMQAAIVEKLAAKPKGVPYRSRLMMSMILGKDLDGSTSPFALMRNRAVFAKPTAPPPQPGPAGAGKLTLATRMQTPDQAGAARGTR